MSTNFYVYGLFAPGRSPELFYIGKGQGHRSKAHFRPSSKGRNPHKDRIIEKYPECYDKILFENLSEVEAFEIERSLIAENKDSVVNLTEGGEGPSGYKHTEEWKAQASERTVGAGNPFYAKTHTLEARQKISEGQTGEKNHRFGKKLSDQHKKILKESVSGENSPAAKLTDKQIDQIRKLYATGSYTHKMLATQYNCSQSHICLLVNNKRRVFRSPYLDP